MTNSWRSTSRSRENARSGTSPAASSGVRWRPSCCPNPSGWGLVPDTVERPEGPFGDGSVQRYVHEDGTSHYFTLPRGPPWHPALIALCAFDVAANNADRKSGHVLLAEDRLWAIDNGLCFNELDKLRTVIWDFGGEPLAPDDTAALERLGRDGPSERLCQPHPVRGGRAGGSRRLAGASAGAARLVTTEAGHLTRGRSCRPVPGTGILRPRCTSTRTSCSGVRSSAFWWG